MSVFQDPSKYDLRAKCSWLAQTVHNIGMDDTFNIMGKDELTYSVNEWLEHGNNLMSVVFEKRACAGEVLFSKCDGEIK